MEAPLDVKIGQLIMSGFEGTTADEAAVQLGPNHIGNAVLVGANVVSPDQLLALTEGLQARASLHNGAGMLISIDQEGGRVVRLQSPFVVFPPAGVIGCIGEPEFAQGAARVMGEEMLAVGINMNLAPVADVADNPANTTIGDRAFGSTPDIVSPMVAASIAGYEEAHIAATVKHFPGHGSTAGDSHDGQVIVTKSLAELEQTELPPFGDNLSDADVVMMSNVDYLVLDPASIPASLSAPTIALLRDDLGYDAVITTDALGMGAVSNRWGPGDAAVMAISSGADMVLFTSPAGAAAAHSALLEAVLSGRIPMGRIDEAIARILELKARTAMRPSGEIAQIGSPDHQGMGDLIARARTARGC
jgi:beta-N-acetylhexosaminidase